mmetsp:Transcript_46195/g.88161  ORF Transcript_46195/g.88161 Transcript_46195/m.88161 type:complete len:313 (-) Transcript_46195:579-1517(-)|eukprot:CAMPEP_0114226886 /NCGR_PEP_ID=MMETSP0058-20121206/1482_1 /TAXON_ID=36894 /ORGANISM="Pyramimonas parkeae, CCMP726" /LENGTH=312 /DNA_ID=CAMNT_0001337663 /DNA_START=180 /DNA_END=1118 /DNA_ORIENTATION=+
MPVTLEQMVLDLTDPTTRENALLDLSKKREAFPDLAPILWHSFGVVSALLQEIACIYPLISPPSLTAHASNRVCNALALLQCIASHPDTRALFLHAHIPLFLYPFLNTVSKTRPFEYLRLTSLGVIGALVKVDDTDVINFLLATEIIPLCLRTMEMGSELSKTVATFIVQKILLDEVGLSYICATAERFFAVGAVLGSMVTALTEQPSIRLLKHIIRCYLRLSDNPRYLCLECPQPKNTPLQNPPQTLCVDAKTMLLQTGVDEMFSPFREILGIIINGLANCCFFVDSAQSKQCLCPTWFLESLSVSASEYE